MPLVLVTAQRVEEIALGFGLHALGDHIFPNDSSITRLVGAMMLEQNDEWSLNRRYMQLEGLQTLCDTPPTRLSAVAR